ncbi:hypothetical protein EDB84DRAFT_1443062 [Lactarius hengduanensis]|nr:hypothetical protein EDB84DRAFT_1443062 [Lactarius hengduanensis]
MSKRWREAAKIQAFKNLTSTNNKAVCLSDARLTLLHHVHDRAQAVEGTTCNRNCDVILVRNSPKTSKSALLCDMRTGVVGFELLTLFVYRLEGSFKAAPSYHSPPVPLCSSVSWGSRSSSIDIAKWDTPLCLQTVSCSPSRSPSRTKHIDSVTLRPRSFIVAFTTRDQWRTFQPYHLERRGDRNVPILFLGAARWREYRGDEGYFVDFASGPTRFRPIEFNFKHSCWVEVTWNPIDNHWDAIRLAGRNYNCDIDAQNLPVGTNWGPIDGAPTEEPSTSEPRTPAPSEGSESEHTSDQESEEEDNETSQLVQQAESLHINEPEVIHINPPEMATETITQEELVNEEVRRIQAEAEAILLPINPETRHRMTADDAALYRAVGPD